MLEMAAQQQNRTAPYMLFQGLEKYVVFCVLSFHKIRKICENRKIVVHRQCGMKQTMGHKTDNAA
jgi:hypothetical protein